MPAVSIYTHKERTQKTKSIKQAYEHAGMVLRTQLNITQRVLFPWNAYDSVLDSENTLTVEQFSQKVSDIINGFSYFHHF